MNQNPPKDYAGLYGEAKCLNCAWYAESERIEGRMRCRIPSNMVKKRIGSVYKESPSGKNHLGRCIDYEENFNSKS